MYRIVGLLFFCFLSLYSFSQQGRTVVHVSNLDSTLVAQQDTVKETRRERKRREQLEKEAKEPVIFKDSARLAIEALTEKAWKRSAILPGWGQYTNGGLWWIKAPVIYAGFTATVLTFDFYNKYYKELLTELKYRSENPGGQEGNPDYINANTQGLITAKDFARRNRDLMVLLTVGVYGLNVVEAYVDSMLKNRWNIGNSLGVKVSPTLLPYARNSYAFSPYPTMGLKITMQLK